MKANGQGKGKIVPTGKSEPRIDVEYDIGHKPIQTQESKAPVPRFSMPIVHSITPLNEGETLPMGECDLLIGDELLRLRHREQHPEWLVLSLD